MHSYKLVSRAHTSDKGRPERTYNNYKHYRMVHSKWGQ